MGCIFGKRNHLSGLLFPIPEARCHIFQVSCPPRPVFTKLRRPVSITVYCTPRRIIREHFTVGRWGGRPPPLLPLCIAALHLIASSIVNGGSQDTLRRLSQPTAPVCRRPGTVRPVPEAGCAVTAGQATRRQVKRRQSQASAHGSLQGDKRDPDGRAPKKLPRSLAGPLAPERAGDRPFCPLSPTRASCQHISSVPPASSEGSTVGRARPVSAYRQTATSLLIASSRDPMTGD